MEGLLEALLGLIAGGGHQGLMIFQGNGVEENVVDVGIRSPEKGFAAAGAFGHVKPDNRDPAELLRARATMGLNMGGSIRAPVMIDVHLMKDRRLTPRSFRTS